MNIVNIIEESWSWSGIEPDEIVGENDFGNLIIRDIYGKYWRLCPEDLYCKIVANNREELDVLSKDQSFLADWYMSNLTAIAKDKLGPLQPGKKYHLKVPGALGGEYGFSNLAAISQIEQLRFSGDISNQIKELPDGATIQLKVTE